MHHATRVTFPRFALLVSSITAAGLVACSDASTAPHSPLGLTASADKGGSGGGSGGSGGSNSGRGNQNENENNNEGHNNQGQGNNNQNADTARVELRIRLVRPATTAPDSNAEGQAKFESRRGRMKLNIEGEHLTTGDTVNFFVNNVQVGTRVVNSFGEAELELDSQKGQTIPAVVAGTAVAVKTKAGATLVSGTF
ncbi:MAG TPA: hypothetical protein VK636_05095 [Gemmatimonadaceae bacterium]|nr:hypothetical protein [Gemmatimonadaceae bacterium]